MFRGEGGQSGRKGLNVLAARIVAGVFPQASSLPEKTTHVVCKRSEKQGRS